MEKFRVACFSIYSSLVGLASRPTYILYQYISSFRQHNISYSFLSSLSAAGVSSLEVKYGIFGNGDEGTWQKHLEWYSQHKIVDPYPQSQTSLQTEEAFMVEEYKLANKRARER